MTSSNRRRARVALVVLCLATGVGSAPPASKVGWVADSTRAMAARLQEAAAKVDPAALPFVVNDRRAAALARKLEEPLPLARQIALRFDYATELVNSGRTPEAIAAIDDLVRDAQAINPQAARRGVPRLMLLKAVAYLRQGEQDNCNAANTRHSCLLPIRGTGIHRDTRGSTRAAEVLAEVLALEPDNLRARWLLNVAQMTLGGYPQRVPKQFLVPPEAFAAEYPLPRFTNVAHDVGLDIFGLSGGAILEDFDGDGGLDLMVSAIGFEDQLRFFHNSKDGRFEERTRASGLLGETGGLNLVQADYDNDGRVDALVLRGGWMGREGAFPLSLLRNNGDGTFTDTTVAARLTHAAPTQTAVWLDYDGDGWLDLFVGNESSPGAVHACELFHNERDGTFSERAAELGLDVVGFVKGVASADYDNDGRPDLYLSLGGGANLLFHNDGPAPGAPGGWRFSERARQAGVAEPLRSFSTFFFDYDNDGWSDLFVVSYSSMAEDVAADYLGLETSAERPRLFKNRGDGTFEDVTRAAGLYRALIGMGLNFGDLDNDGWLDFYVGTGNPDLSTLVPNRMFRNDAGRRFQDVTTAGDFGHLQKGHGICFGDVDDDGDQDVFEQMGGAAAADVAHSVLYANPGNANAWVELELRGVHSNRSALGARLKLELDGPQGRRTLHRTVTSGGSFGASPLRQSVGLGSATRIVAVEILWPATGRTQRVEGLKPRRRYLVREDEPRAQPVERRAFTLAGLER